jgi:hypothetical protein
MIEYINDAKPLIIVGRQRAGTRHITKILNSFSEVIVQGEIPNQLMSYIQELIKVTNQSFEGVEDGDNSIESHQAIISGVKEINRAIIFSFWANCAKQERKEPWLLYKHLGIKDILGLVFRKKVNKPYNQNRDGNENILSGIIEIKDIKIPVRNISYYGYKSPNNEQYFDFYEDIFSEMPPVYIYCIRNFKDNFLSVSTRWPERKIENVADQYLASIKQFHYMKKTAPERVLLFNLDRLITEGFDYVEQDIITKLNLKLTRHLRKLCISLPPSNSAELKLKIERRKELNKEELEYYQSHPELEDEFRKLC